MTLTCRHPRHLVRVICHEREEEVDQLSVCVQTDWIVSESPPTVCVCCVCDMYKGQYSHSLILRTVCVCVCVCVSVCVWWGSLSFSFRTSNLSHVTLFRYKHFNLLFTISFKVHSFPAVIII